MPEAEEAREGLVQQPEPAKGGKARTKRPKLLEEACALTEGFEEVYRELVVERKADERKLQRLARNESSSE